MSGSMDKGKSPYAFYMSPYYVTTGKAEVSTFSGTYEGPMYLVVNEETGIREHETRTLPDAMSACQKLAMSLASAQVDLQTTMTPVGKGNYN